MKVAGRIRQGLPFRRDEFCKEGLGGGAHRTGRVDTLLNSHATDQQLPDQMQKKKHDALCPKKMPAEVYCAES